jgi:deoxyadenosine/deoxycytidine kinase
MRAHHEPKYIALEGNIGAGKSTILTILARVLPLQIVLEPHAKWQNVAGDNLFERYYKDPHRWAYTFQTHVLVTRIIEQEKKVAWQQNTFPVFERSIYSDRFCFAENCYQMGLINDLEWKLYLKFFEWLAHNHAHKPYCFIYLRTDPEICYQRLIKRGRFEEMGITKEYLNILHAKHDLWLLEKAKEYPVLVLDGDDEFETNSAIQNAYEEKIRQFFQSIAINISKIGIQAENLL